MGDRALEGNEADGTSERVGGLSAGSGPCSGGNPESIACTPSPHYIYPVGQSAKPYDVDR